MAAHPAIPTVPVSISNNDILRRVRYIFDFSDDRMIALFGLANREVTRAEVSDWLKRDTDPAYQDCSDVVLATFLNGLIVDRRGERSGPSPEPEQQLNNNIILTKLKIALALSGEGVMEVLAESGHPMGKHEVSALFRRPGHKNYRQCLDQVLRNFLKGLQTRYRASVEPAND